MSPLEFLRRGGTAIGEDGIERERTESSGSDGAGEGAELAIERSSGEGGGELPAEQADLGTVSGGRCPVHAETLRGWRKEAGLWQRQRRRKPYRRRREAKAHFGELVQLDGSFHEWLEERGPRRCLMHMVDDATRKPPNAQESRR